MIIDSKNPRFNEYWNSLSSKVGFNSPLYSINSKNYYRQITSDNGIEFFDISFIYIDKRAQYLDSRG